MDYTRHGYWNGILNAGVCKLLILRAVCERPTHGYRLIQRISEDTGHQCVPTQGTVYPVLREFEACGCVHSRIEKAHGRERRIYTATAKGRRALRAGLEVWRQAMTHLPLGAPDALTLKVSRAPREDAVAVRAAVREGYAAIARGGGSCCGPNAGCCGTQDAAAVARTVGYADAELAMLPEGANMGLSCGNPGALAALRPGEVVLDLGSGGGFDVFLAAPKVGPRGRAIGVDMTPEMVNAARRNAEDFHRRTGLNNVEFRLGEIEHLPVSDASVDAVISNCVLNLSPDKPQVWREITRVLKPGGRVAVSDLALLKPLPPSLRASVEALVGCVAGAVLAKETRAMAKAAGLTDLALTPRPGYVDAMTDWNDPLYKTLKRALPRGTKLGDFVTSLEIAARKPM